MSSVKEETIRSAKWTSIEKFVMEGMGFAIGLLLARMLAPSDYGTVAMIGIFMAISGLIIDSGFGNALIRKQDRTEVDFSTIFYFNLASSVFFYIVLFLIAPWVSLFFNTPILCSIMRVQSLNLIIGALMAIPSTKLVIALDFKALALRSVLASGLSGVFGVILAYNGFGVWSLVYMYLMSSIIKLVFVWGYCRWIPLAIFSLKSFKELGGYGSKLLASSILNTIYTELTTFVIAKFFSPKELGFYNRGTSYAKLPIDTFNGVIGRIIFPIMVKLQDNDEHLITVYRKYICITSLCNMFGCMMLAANAKPLILILLTDKWAPSIIYLQIYTFCIMFTHINSINLDLLKVKGRSDLYLRLEIVKKCISMSILFAAIPFGVIGICISRIIYSQIAIAFNTYYTGKLFNLGYVKQIKDYSVFFFSSIVACLPAYIINIYCQSLYVGLLIGVITCPLLYSMILRNNVYYKEVITTAKNSLYKK